MHTEQTQASPVCNPGLPQGANRKQLFAGRHYVLILTGDGRLYGLGDNQNHQIASSPKKAIQRPQLMADNVISAAAGLYSSIYVTRDGTLHMQGFGGHLALPMDARTVYADPCRDQFWVVKADGIMECFGTNYEGELVDTQRVFLKEYPDVVCHQGPRQFVPHPWSPRSSGISVKADYPQAIRSAAVQVQSSTEFMHWEETYGRGNVVVQLKLLSEQARRIPFTGTWEFTHHFRATVWHTNYILPDLVFFRNRDFTATPHFMGSRPLPPEYRQILARYPGIQKAVRNYAAGWDSWLLLMEDRQLLWIDSMGEVSNMLWTDGDIYDIALMEHKSRDHNLIPLITCTDGSIFILKPDPFANEPFPYTPVPVPLP